MEDKQYKWIRNASANFATITPSPSDPMLYDFAKIKARCSNEVAANRMYDYDELLDYGFNFGPSLRVVQGGWKSDSNDEFIFKFTTLNHLKIWTDLLFTHGPWTPCYKPHL